MIKNSNGTLSLTSFKELCAYDKWLFFPAASGSAYFLSFITDEAPQLADKIVGYSDSDSRKWGKIQDGYSVIPKDDISDSKPDVIIVTSPAYFEEIEKDLRLRVPENTLIVAADSIDEYMAWESKRSFLAKRFANKVTDDIDLSPFTQFFQALPFAGSTYSHSTKGALTYRLLDQAQIPQDFKGKSVLDRKSVV